MGSYNNVVLTCPSCGSTLLHQSKAGSCRMKESRIKNSELSDVADAASIEHTCPSCSVVFELEVQVLAREVVKTDHR